MSISETHTFVRIRRIYDNRLQPEYARAFADLYWRTLLSIAVIITVAACLYGASLFSGALSLLSSSTPSASPASAASLPSASNLNPAALESTLTAFAQREVQFEALQGSTVPPLSDPSQ